MNMVWPAHVYNQDEWKTYDLIIPAYMDDTSFMGRNREDLQSSLDITNQFYDIFINGKKCDLIVINPLILKALRFVIIGQDRIEVMATNKEVRYLGIWISAKHTRKKWMDRLKLIVDNFLKVCNKKVFGVGHLAYIVN